MAAADAAFSTHTTIVCCCGAVAAVCRLDQTELSRLGVHQLRRFLEALLQVSNAEPFRSFAPLKCSNYSQSFATAGW